MSKKLLIILIPFLLIPVVLFGLKKFPLNKKPVIESSAGTIRLWGLWENADISALLFESFKNLYPDIKIEYEDRNTGGLAEYKDLVFTRLLEGTAPDVILVHASWMPELLPYLKGAHDTAFTVADFNKDYYSAVSKVCVYGTAVACVAPSFDDLALVYNKDMFLQAGITTLPATWEDFRSYAKKLTVTDSSGKIVVGGTAMGASKNVAFASDIIGLMLVQNNLKIPDNLDSKEAKEVFSYYSDFIKKDKVWDALLPNSLEALASGKVAMAFAPSRAMLGVLNSALSGVNLAVAPVPQIPTTDGATITSKNWASFWVFVVPATSKNSKVAWDFIKFVTSKDELLKQYEAQSIYRVFGQVLPITTLAETIGKNTYLAPYVLGSANAEVSLISAESGNDAYTGAINVAIDAVLSGTSLDGALSQAKTTITTLQATKRKKL